MTRGLIILGGAALTVAVAAAVGACGTPEPTVPFATEPAAGATEAPATAPTEALTPTLAAPNPLAGTSWVVSSLAGTEPISGTSLTLVFGKDGSVGGTDGCNQFGATYAVDGSGLTIDGPMTGTLMACPDAVMQQADQYRRALATVTTFEAVTDTLTLRGEAEEIIVYKAQGQDLAGTSWAALSYNNGSQAVVSVAAGTEITATFGTDGKLSGYAGCNRYTGPYEAAEGSITIGALASTKMACPEPAMSQEAQYLAALPAAATYAIEAGKLALRAADGSLVASYMAIAPE